MATTTMITITVTAAPEVAVLFLSHLSPQVVTNKGTAETPQTSRGLRPQPNHPDLEQKETEQTEATSSLLTQLPPVKGIHAGREC